MTMRMAILCSIIPIIAMGSLAFADDEGGFQFFKQPLLKEFYAKNVQIDESYTRRIENAKTEEEKAALEEELDVEFRKHRQAYFPRVMAFVREHPTDDATVPSLVWLEDASFSKDADYDYILEQLASRAHRLTLNQASLVMGHMDSLATPKAGDLLRAIAAKGATAEIRGIALLELGRWLRQQADSSSRSDAKRSKRLRDEARATFLEVEQKYPDILWREERLADQVARDLYELTYLTIGAEAPTFQGQGLHGEPIELKSFRGKVTLVIFSTEWCPHCRTMERAVRDLRKAIDPSRFAVVTVMGGTHPEEMREKLTAEGVDWPVIWEGGGPEGGEIIRQWNISFWPMTYLLDAQGRIQRKDVRLNQLEVEVKELVEASEP